MFDFAYFFSVMPNLIKKIPFTLYLGTVSFLLSILLGGLLAVLKRSKSKIISGFTTGYISLFRSTPYITQLFILYFGLPQVFPVFRIITAETALIVSIAMNSSAFIAEIIRGALLSIDKGQIEAALSIGLSNFHIAKNIIIPQAIVTAIPSLGNSYVSMIKSTSMGFTIGVIEMLSQAKIGSASSYKFLESYVAVGFLYWIMVLIIDYLQKLLEKRTGIFLKR